MGAWKSVQLKHYPAYPIIVISLIIQRNLATKIWAKWESSLTAVWLKQDPPVPIRLDWSSGIWGQLMTCDLTIGLHTLKWQAYVADMPDQCLLGLDFLINYGVYIQLSKNSIMVMGKKS